MGNAKHYFIRYKQEFMDVILEGSYDVYDTSEGVHDRERILYEDPHVFSVEIIEVKGELNNGW